jgi:hypothetical protein
MINIHSGDVMAIAARRAGVPGEHFAFREALVVGPIPKEEKWIEERAKFLSDRYGEELLRASNAVFQQQQALTAAASQDEIVLWFEHDLFCLVNLMYLLQRFDRASIIWSPEPLADQEEKVWHRLFNTRYPVTPAMRESARAAWKIYSSGDPRELNKIIASDQRDFPFLREGMTLHASRFPSTRNGLGAVENRFLQLIAGGATEFATLFSGFEPSPPRFGFGDSEVLAALRDLAKRKVPLITMTEVEGTPPKAILALTPEGEQVMNGASDDVKLNPPNGWLGGVHLTSDNVFRWDETAKRIG